MRFLHIVGARPNFMKVAPVMASLARHPESEQTLVHSGQHYDTTMSQVFFSQLGIPSPDINLGVGSASHAEQTANVMRRLEPVIKERRPDIVVVYGDVNSTLAAALVCAKLGVHVAHVEAGLRSFDRSMPEEINRLVTDQLSNSLFTPSEDADENLHREGIDASRIHLVGNVMIDTLVRLLPAAKEAASSGSLSLPLQLQAVKPEGYGVVTLHRPSNVDDDAMLSRLVTALVEISHSLPLVFPVHPRTREKMEKISLDVTATDLLLCEPVGYLEFLALQTSARVVITDSGGVQEETTFLGIPCLTLRTTTERPITVTLGTNVVIGTDLHRLRAEVRAVISGTAKRGRVPPLWDGEAATRIADVLLARAL